jgi:hypothetical protein
MLKIRKFIKYSMIDSIDKSRANAEYIKLMKEMKISNRVNEFESWLLGREWGTEAKKKVTHVHVLECPNSVKTKKVQNSRRYSIVIPNNLDLEIIKQVNPSKVNKAISYLKWKRNKYRPNETVMSYEGTADILKIWNNLYGFKRVSTGS